MKRVILAATYAAHKHRDQRRKNQVASPYINHPLALAKVLTNEDHGVEDEDVVVAVLLHDTIDDTLNAASGYATTCAPMPVAWRISSIAAGPPPRGIRCGQSAPSGPRQWWGCGTW